MTKPITLQLPFPPSINTYWRNGTLANGKRRMMLSGKAREYKKLVYVAAINQKPSLFPGYVRAVICLHRPDSRRRDCDNYLKAVLDALIGITWADDSQITDLRIFWAADKPRKPGAAVISIEDHCNGIRPYS